MTLMNSMAAPVALIPRPAHWLVRLLVGKVRVVGVLPPGPVLLCSNHNSYRDVFLFGMISPTSRLLAHPLVFTFPLLKEWALRWGFVQASIDDAVALLKRGETVAICPTGLVEASGEMKLPFKNGAVRIAQQSGVALVPVHFKYGNYPGRWITPFPITPFFITVQNMLLFCLWPFYRRGVTIRIGSPYLPSGEVKAATAALKDRIRILGR